MKSKYLVFVGMGVELVGLILTCLFVGKMLDERFQTKGLALAGLPILGLAGWIYHIVQLTQKMEKTADDVGPEDESFSEAGSEKKP